MSNDIMSNDTSSNVIDKLNLYSDKFFLLKIYLDENVSHDIVDKYIDDISKRQKLVEKYINRYYIQNTDIDSSCDVDQEHIHIDSGIDLYVPSPYDVGSETLVKVNTYVKTAMYYDNIPCGFYLYPRSSTGTKTPLRLANSVGVIDSGYRGNCIAAFDNITTETYNIKKGDRLVQICASNLVYPIYPVIVNTVEELGYTSRGSGGFGSTGR